ncbi:hypothetical protein WOC76_14545 [Methylocystis sp. IM3]|uniref:hypothetical protein n=1 Tax=unclassified Methylocystis TaxID=2625913 RepID=UPI0030F567C0
MVRHDWTRIDREWRSSKRAVLAYYVGGWREGESPLEALARALGVASEELPLDSSNPMIERDELDHLSTCLGAGWVELGGLNIEESVALAVSLLNEKLAYVPQEVRAFFDAPHELEPSLIRRRPERQAVLRRFN